MNYHLFIGWVLACRSRMRCSAAAQRQRHTAYAMRLLLRSSRLCASHYLTAALGLVLSLGLITAASAHAKLVSSDPKAGANLTTAPTKLTLIFTEEISDKADETYFKVTDASGKLVGTGKLDNTDLDHKTVSGTLNGVGNGVYTVNWRAVTPDDGGITTGSFTFGVNADPGKQPDNLAGIVQEEGNATTTTTEATTQSSAGQGAATAAAATATTASSSVGTSAAIVEAQANASTPVGGANPGSLPQTGESGSNLAPYALIIVVIVLVLGFVFRRKFARSHH